MTSECCDANVNMLSFCEDCGEFAENIVAELGIWFIDDEVVDYLKKRYTVEQDEDYLTIKQ